MVSKEEKALTGIHTICCEMAKVSSSVLGEVPEELLQEITKEAFANLPIEIADSLDAIETQTKIANAISDATIKLAQNDTVTKTGGSTMNAKHEFNEDKKSNFEPDYIDALMTEHDKIAATTNSKLAGVQALQSMIASDPFGAQSAAIIKLASLTKFVDKQANEVEQLKSDVAQLLSIGETEADATIQDGDGKAPVNDAELASMEQADGKGTGRTVMKGDPTGTESAITGKNPGAGGVKPNPKGTVGDVLASSRAGKANLRQILEKRKAGKK